MKVLVDEEKCIGCGACVAICPEVFEIGDNGKCSVKEKETNKKCVKEAESSCPVEAIVVS